MKARKAFTLVEMLIVVIILGLLAAVMVPRFSNASATARASMLMDNLRIFRAQIEVFKGQHCGVAPGYPLCDVSQEPTSDTFIAHMTQASDQDGRTAEPGTAGYRYGPYFREIPQNPVNGRSSVQIVPAGQPFPETADDSHGWVYQPSTLIFKADSSGKDEKGVAYIDY